MHKVFISYHHDRDQQYADNLRTFYGNGDAFMDSSLPEEIDSEDDEYILSRIRTEHLKESTVTVVLVGGLTWSRKWVDWEIYSSLRPYGNRTINGLLGVLLPDAGQWPARFQDNFRTSKQFGETRQTGYARVVRWDKICPPTLLDRFLGIEQSVALQHRKTLIDEIDRVFQRRTERELVVNTRPRMRKNAPVTPWWY